MFTRRIAHAIVATLVAATAPATLAQTFDLDWYTIDAGGGASLGGTFDLAGTIGQPDAGVMTGGTYTLVGGLWPGAQPTASPCPGDLDGDGDVDLGDLALVLQNFLGNGTPSPGGDLDGDGDTDLSDLALLLQNFGLTCP